MAEVSLSDRYVLLLENVVEENKRLRKVIEERDAAQQRLIAELSTKLDNSGEPRLVSGKRRRREKVSVPQLCRREFKKLYKVLLNGDNFDGFNLNERLLSQSNQNVTNTVIEAVMADHGGTDNCPWSCAQLKGAAGTYYKSLTDSLNRKRKGTSNQHKTVCRRQGRIRDKIQRRTLALKNVQWSERCKEALAQVLIPEYTSSDESDLSEGEDGQQVVRAYLVKKLPWERTALRKAKKELDRVHLRKLTPRARGMLLERKPHPEQSKRPLPSEVYDWAVRQPETPSQNVLTPPSSTSTPKSISRGRPSRILGETTISPEL